MKKYHHLLYFLLFIIPSVLIGQIDLNAELQVYPTGFIPGIRAEYRIDKKDAIHLRLGYQIIDHRDLGKHDDENGNGYGFSLGYKRYFSEGHEGWHGGVRTDLWWNSIDWTQSMSSGNSEITVLQPTADLGYLFKIGSQTILTPTLSFGWEWNIKTIGEATGEGAILLVGIQFGQRF